MSSSDPPEEADDTEANIIESEPCDACGGAGATGRGRGFEWCSECINIPDMLTPDDLPEDPRSRLAELKEEQAQSKQEQEELREALDKISEARDLIGEAVECDVFNDDTAVVLNHLSNRVGREITHYRQSGYQPERFDERIRELQQFVDLLDRRQGGEGGSG